MSVMWDRDSGEITQSVNGAKELLGTVEKVVVSSNLQATTEIDDRYTIIESDRPLDVKITERIAWVG